MITGSLDNEIAFLGENPDVLVQRIVRLDQLEAGLNEALDIIVWMSGADAFGPGGQAQEGWVRTRDRLDALFALAGRP